MAAPPEWGRGGGRSTARTALALGLAVAANVAVPHPKFGIFRM